MFNPKRGDGLHGLDCPTCGALMESDGSPRYTDEKTFGEYEKAFGKRPFVNGEAPPRHIVIPHKKEECPLMWAGGFRAVDQGTIKEEALEVYGVAEFQRLWDAARAKARAGKQ